MIPQIPEPLFHILRDIGEVGGKGTYLVGGSVRDLLLERESLDIDIVVEGDALQVAEAMRERWNGTLHQHPQFGTATVTPENAAMPKVDFVTARYETYQHAGTLPIVKRGTLADDLRRRDFTINALAMRLDANAFGTIIDETGGLADLGTGTIRVLHKQSFRDDPTRIFRACRYAGRYGFHIADDDKALIIEALPILSSLTGERIRNELDRVLLEENAPQIVEHLTEFNVWKTICKGWEIGQYFDRRFASAQRALRWASEHLTDEPFHPEHVRWMTLFCGGMPDHWLEAISFRLVLPHELQRIRNPLPEDARFQLEEILVSPSFYVESRNGKWLIVDMKNNKTYVRAPREFYGIFTPFTAYGALLVLFLLLPDEPTPGAVHSMLKFFPLEAAVLAMYRHGLTDAQREQIGTYLHTLRKVPPLVTGHDLIEWGEKPGKMFQTFLSRLFAAQLDGEITTKSEARRWLQAYKKDKGKAVSEKS